MDEPHRDCRYEAAYTVQFNSLKEDLRDLKERVNRLEGMLARGMLLLLANLAGALLTLARQLI